MALCILFRGGGKLYYFEYRPKAVQEFRRGEKGSCGPSDDFLWFSRVIGLKIGKLD